MSVVVRLQRWVLRRPPPRISRDEAVAIAKEEVRRLEWPWREPYWVIEHLSHYAILTGIDVYVQAHIDVDIYTGAVIWAAMKAF